MKVTFLGTNGWFTTATGHTVSTLIETKTEYLILDAGSAIAFADKFITKSKPIYLFLSHMHLDHTVGLHYLNKFDFKRGIKILVYQKLLKPLKILMNAPYTLPPSKVKTKTSIIPSEKWGKLPLKIKAFKLSHSDDCYGLRFENEGKIISYAADTGLCPNIYKLAKNADLLISECSYRSNERRPHWPHLNPQDASSVAKKSKAKKLALIHFDPRRYTTFKSRQTALKFAKKIFKNTIVPKDLQQIEV